MPNLTIDTGVRQRVQKGTSASPIETRPWDTISDRRRSLPGTRHSISRAAPSWIATVICFKLIVWP